MHGCLCCSDLAEVLLFRVPDGRRSVCESSANSKEQINALNSLPVTAPFKKGQNSNRRAPWQRTLPGLRLPSERQEKESFPSCMHAKRLRPVGKRRGARLHFFFCLSLPSLLSPEILGPKWKLGRCSPRRAHSHSLWLICTPVSVTSAPGPRCAFWVESGQISPRPPQKKTKEKTLRCIDRAAGKRTLWPRYERVCGLVIKGKQGPPRGLAEFREASHWAARKRIGFRGGKDTDCSIRPALHSQKQWRL